MRLAALALTIALAGCGQTTTLPAEDAGGAQDAVTDKMTDSATASADAMTDSAMASADATTDAPPTDSAATDSGFAQDAAADSTPPPADSGHMDSAVMDSGHMDSATIDAAPDTVEADTGDPDRRRREAAACAVSCVCESPLASVCV